MKKKGDDNLSTTMNQKYSQLKDKLNAISKNTPVLKGKDGMVELDPNNPKHREWYEVDNDHFKSTFPPHVRAFVTPPFIR